MNVLVHPEYLPHAKLLSVPDDWLLCWQDQIAEQHRGLRKFSAFELYELIHGLYSACGVTLQEAEEVVLEHIGLWRGCDQLGAQGSSAQSLPEPTPSMVPLDLL